MCIIFCINFRLVLPVNKQDVNITKSTPLKHESKESQTISTKTDKPLGN